MKPDDSPDRPHTASEILERLQAISPALETESVALQEAVGRVLRESVVAPVDQPTFDRSAVDGYAVRRDDPGSTFRCVDSIRAGDFKPRSLAPGETVRVATGAALPADDLLVVMQEQARIRGSEVHIPIRGSASHIRFRGEDARAGQVLVRPGTVLTPGALALLASVGKARPLVTRRPRVLHLATGNEIVPPEQQPGPGQIFDSNSTLVKTWLGREVECLQHWRVTEDAAGSEAIVQRLDSDLDGLDLLLISGGASVGQHDFTRALLQRLGFKVLVGQAATRPGKPLLVAQRDTLIAFGLPGNPLAHFVCLNLYVRTVLNGFAGKTRVDRFSTGVLATALDAGDNPRETFWPAHAENQAGRVMLTALRWASSGDVTALARANALLRIAPGQTSLPAGTHLEYAPAD